MSGDRAGARLCILILFGLVTALVLGVSWWPPPGNPEHTTPPPGPFCVRWELSEGAAGVQHVRIRRVTCD